jgi:hypothetical protein
VKGRTSILRGVTLGLALVHTFPARVHLAAFFETPSLADGWKGFGALVAIGLYLMPVRLQVRGLTALWRRQRVLRATAFFLAVVHLVPALDHLPKFLENCRWCDAWRGVGSGLAVAWFLAPAWVQGRIIAALARFARFRPCLAGLQSAGAPHQSAA